MSKELTEKILQITSQSAYGWLTIDSAEGKKIMKLIKKEKQELIKELEEMEQEIETEDTSPEYWEKVGCNDAIRKTIELINKTN